MRFVRPEATATICKIYFARRGSSRNRFSSENNPRSVRSAWNCDEFQFADAKDREQLLPPTATVGFGSDAGAVKDGSSVAKIAPDRALVSFKEVPMTTVKTHHDAREVACGEIGVLTVERAALINDFEVP